MVQEGRRFLRLAYFFRNLEDEALDAVARVCHPEVHDAGEIIFREDDQGDRLFIVLSGEVQVWKHRGREDENLLAVHGTGRFFGEMALVDELPRSATAVAARRSELLCLRREDFRGLVKRYPELAISVMRSLSAIVRESNDSFVADLYHRNRELERAYLELEKAQRDLLRNERLSNLGKMSNMILHDIRNPVSVLKGYAEMLLRGADDPERVRDAARRIATQAEGLNHLAGELMDYARGEVRLDASIVAPSEIVKAACHYLTERRQIQDIELTVGIEDDSPVIVDFQRMVRALLNVLDNARKACGADGTIRVTVRRSGGMLDIVVEDSGEGMSPEVADSVFEPFFSGSSEGGTGLGMVVVRNVVDAHHGTLSVESQMGLGTRITITIPEKMGR